MARGVGSLQRGQAGRGQASWLLCRSSLEGCEFGGDCKVQARQDSGLARKEAAELLRSGSANAPLDGVSLSWLLLVPCDKAIRGSGWHHELEIKPRWSGIFTVMRDPFKVDFRPQEMVRSRKVSKMPLPKTDFGC